MTSTKEGEKPSSQPTNSGMDDARPGLIDERDGYVLFYPAGIFTAEEVASQFDQLRLRLAMRRRRGQPVKVLIDLRNAAVQPKETAAYIEDNTDRLYDMSDRMVIVVDGPIQRLQMKRVTSGRPYQIFLSLAEAEASLAAD